MISAAHPAASWFLYALCLVVGLVIAVPLLFFPLRWARAVGWRTPDDTDLVVYLARCLGGVVAAVVVIVLRIAPKPEANLLFFEVIGLICAVVAAIHALGWIEGRQPWIENVETVFYAAIAAACWGFQRSMIP